MRVSEAPKGPQGSPSGPGSFADGRSATTPAQAATTARPVSTHPAGPESRRPRPRSGRQSRHGTLSPPSRTVPCRVPGEPTLPVIQNLGCYKGGKYRLRGKFRLRPTRLPANHPPSVRPTSTTSSRMDMTYPAGSRWPRSVPDAERSGPGDGDHPNEGDAINAKRWERI